MCTHLSHISEDTKDDSLKCEKEPENTHDKYAIAIIQNSRIIGHVPQSFTKAFINFCNLVI